jgi:16S rRNA (uracil1498-N3)-methyltransferase
MFHSPKKKEMHLFFIPNIQSDDIFLDEKESKHCIRVLRLKEQDTISITDGKGNLYVCEIVSANIKKCRLHVISKKEHYGKLGYRLHIAIAPTKNTDRFEWFIEKSTEIGITEITPLISSRSERKSLKKERLNKIIIAAMKQSEKMYKPELNQLVMFREFITENTSGECLYAIAHCQHGEKTEFKSLCPKYNRATVLIGPEGDFSTDEIELAKTNGYQEISLGKSKLRTETAGVLACHCFNLLHG